MGTKSNSRLEVISELCDSVLCSNNDKNKDELIEMMLEYVSSRLDIKEVLEGLDGNYQNIAWIEFDDIEQKQKIKDFVHNGLGYSTSQIERKSNVNLL